LILVRKEIICLMEILLWIIIIRLVLLVLLLIMSILKVLSKYLRKMLEIFHKICCVEIRIWWSLIIYIYVIICGILLEIYVGVLSIWILLLISVLLSSIHCLIYRLKYSIHELRRYIWLIVGILLGKILISLHFVW
jgi:hypothetical protein